MQNRILSYPKIRKCHQNGTRYPKEKYFCEEMSLKVACRSFVAAWSDVSIRPNPSVYARSYISRAGIYIPRAEMCIPRVEIYIPAREI